MRILHVADAHQGLTTHSSVDAATGLPSAVLSVARCWQKACEIAVNQRVDAVCVAGDAFHTRNPDAASLVYFRTGLNILREAGIPALIIAGNHDAGDLARHSIITLFHDPPHVYALTEPDVVEISTGSIAALPWTSRKHLMATRPGLLREDADKAMSDGLERILDELRARSPDVLMGHWTVQGVMGASERDLSVLVGEPVIPLHALEGPWAYGAFGHIHSSQSLVAAESDITYAGSVDRISFAEEEERKAAIEVVIDQSGDVDSFAGVPGVIKTFHDLPARRFLTLDTREWDAAQVLGMDVEDTIVRVRGTEQSLVTEIAAKATAGGAAKVLAQVEVEKTERARAASVTESISPIQALEEYMALNVEEDRREAVRDVAKKLMEGIC